MGFAQKMGWPILAQFTDLPEKTTSSDIVPITSLIMDKFLDHELKSVHIVYMDFINTISQKVRISRLLPIAHESTPEDDLEVIPKTYKEYLFEPSPKKILDSLLPYYVENSVFQIILEASKGVLGLLHAL